jgi:outer membrane biogenesis lipoprotein LolB
VRYLDYEDDSPSALPTLLELARDDLEIRLRIVDWLRGP